MNTSQQLLEDLETALSVLETRGWVKGSWGSDPGPVCMLGAINVAVIKQAHPRVDAMTQRENTAYDAVRTIIKIHVEDIYSRYNGSMVEWNDSPRTKYEDVKNVLEEAIVAARAVVGIPVRERKVPS